MFTDGQFYVGGLSAAIIACLGTVFNCVTLYVLLATSSIRSNPTTVLIIFLTTSNLIYTSLVLPFTSASMLKKSYFQENPVLCQLYSFFFFWTFGALLFIQVALAVNRWTVVCTDRFRYLMDKVALAVSNETMYFSFKTSTSVISGCVCWAAALIVCLIPTTITGSQQFGWDQDNGE